MKLKNILLPFAGILLLTACEKDHRNDNLVDPRVYIVNNGAQTATYYDVEETLDYNIYAYSSGYFGQASEVKIVLDPDAIEAFNAANGSSYSLLGEDCYQIIKSSGSITAEGRRATLSVRLDCQKIMQLPQMNDYVIPFRLTAAGTEVNEELNTILVNPRMQETEVLVRNAGLVESDLSAADANTLEFVTYTEFNNKWDTESTYDHGNDVLAEYNAANGTQYIPLPADSYTFTEGQLTAEHNEAVSTIKVDKSKLSTDRYYTLAVKLKSNSKFKISEKNTVLFHISLLPIADNRKEWKLILCSSYYTGRGPELMIDGDLVTRWESRYNNTGQGDINPDEAATVWDMGKTYYWCGMTLVRRSDSYVTDLRAGYVELSDDGENWTKAQDFDFGDKTNTSTTGTYSTEQWTVSGRYIRLAVNASNRNKLYSVSEFIPVLAEKTE